MREGKRTSVASLSITAFQIWFRMTAPSVTSGNKIKVTRQGADLGEENQGHSPHRNSISSERRSSMR